MATDLLAMACLVELNSIAEILSPVSTYLDKVYQPAPTAPFKE